MALVTVNAGRIKAVSHLATENTPNDQSIRNVAEKHSDGEELTVSDQLVKRVEELEALRIPAGAESTEQSSDSTEGSTSSEATEQSSAEAEPVSTETPEDDSSDDALDAPPEA